MAEQYVYTKKSFTPSIVVVEHMDLDFDMYETYTRVISTLFFTVKEPTKKITLHAKKLDIEEVSSQDGTTSYEYDQEHSLLHIYFETELDLGKRYSLKTISVCKPTHNILEGLYYDQTPEGAPLQQITQCQQWGFQRLVPCIDEMTTKCTYRTTITADERYTNIISNGDLISGPELVIEGTKTDTGYGRKQVIYENMLTPMAPYLFFLGVGTYATFTQEFEYPCGLTFQLELLAPPNTDSVIAKHALDILNDGVLWIYLYSGPKSHTQKTELDAIYSLSKQRDALKEQGKDLTEIRKQLYDLQKNLIFGYKYTGSVYREIGMQNSDFGGMENVGNTTISTNRLLPKQTITDGAFEYLMRVKTHEFFHNINGSEVTGFSPFEIWLNEAVTVFIESKYASFHFGEEYLRLDTILGYLSPDGGLLRKDKGADSMPIEAEGFNDPNELISEITYQKGPEFVRMLHSWLGEDDFMNALYVYYDRFKHSNATTQDWLSVMEEISGKPVCSLAKNWLAKTSHPEIEVETSYDAKERTYTIFLVQKNVDSDEQAWQFPFPIRLFSVTGDILYDDVIFISSKQTSHVITDIDEPFVRSLNREMTVFSEVYLNQSKEELLSQLRFEDDVVNKYLAFYKLMDEEKTRLLLDPNLPVDEDMLTLYYSLLQDESLLNRYGVAFLTNFEKVEDVRFAYDFEALYVVKKKISTALAKKYRDALLVKYVELRDVSHSQEETYIAQQVKRIKTTELQHVYLGLLSRLEDAEVYALIKKQYYEAKSETEKIAALGLYLETNAADKKELLDDYYCLAKTDLLRWELFMVVIARMEHEDVYQYLSYVEQLPEFRIEQANEQRALYAVFGHNIRYALLRKEGLDFLKKSLLKLSLINEYSTLNVANLFSLAEHFSSPHRLAITEVLVDVLQQTDAKKCPSVFNTFKRMIQNMPHAKREYEAKHGSLDGVLHE